MKKIINAALMVTVITTLFSCQKQKDLAVQTPGTASTETNFNNIARPWPGNVVYTLSEWFSVGLNSGKDGGLSGSYVLTTPIPGPNDPDDTFVKLAYFRKKVEGIDLSTGGFHYHQLPVEFDTPRGHPVLMGFDLGESLFQIFIQPIGIIGILLDPYEFKDCAYRYIVISQEDYAALNVDWSDYRAVARILNFTP